jgi:hypothetical protein
MLITFELHVNCFTADKSKLSYICKIHKVVNRMSQWVSKYKVYKKYSRCLQHIEVSSKFRVKVLYISVKKTIIYFFQVNRLINQNKTAVNTSTNIIDPVQVKQASKEETPRTEDKKISYCNMLQGNTGLNRSSGPTGSAVLNNTVTPAGSVGLNNSVSPAGSTGLSKTSVPTGSAGLNNKLSGPTGPAGPPGTTGPARLNKSSVPAESKSTALQFGQLRGKKTTDQNVQVTENNNSAVQNKFFRGLTANSLN